MIFILNALKTDCAFKTRLNLINVERNSFRHELNVDLHLHSSPNSGLQPCFHHCLFLFLFLCLRLFHHLNFFLCLHQDLFLKFFHALPLPPRNFCLQFVAQLSVGVVSTRPESKQCHWKNMSLLYSTVRVY